MFAVVASVTAQEQLNGITSTTGTSVLHRSLLMIVLSLIGIPVAIVFLRLFIAMSTIPFQIAGSLLRTRLLGKE